MESLDKLLESENCDAGLCVDSLYRCRNDREQIGLVVKRLFDFPVEDVEFYLPQLANIWLFHTIPEDKFASSSPRGRRERESQFSLESYLLDASGRSLHFALHLSWLLDAAAADNHTRTHKPALRLRELVGSASVNRKSYSGKDSVPSSPTTGEGSPLAGAQAKQRRCIFFNDVVGFVQHLTNTSLQLRLIQPVSKRKPKLWSELVSFGRTLEDKVVYFPLFTSRTEFCRVLRFSPKSAITLNSRERCPFLLFFEVVRTGATCGEPELSLPPPPSQESPPEPADPEPNPAVEEEEEDAEQESRLKVPFGNSFARRRKGASDESPLYPKFRTSWDLQSVVVKSGDDIRQELLAMQFIKKFHSIWQSAGLALQLRPYEVLVTGNNCGLIETIKDATSIDGFKKSFDDIPPLLECFKKTFGEEGSSGLKDARKNFVESMAGYSILTYLLQIKDRHNGNIMITRTGQIVHIDFGFMLLNSPGGVNFESAPFKLTAEFVDVMGGCDSSDFQYFRMLFFLGFLEARKHMDKIVSLGEMMLPGENLPCFAGDGAAAMAGVRERLQLSLSDRDLAAWVQRSIDVSVDHWRTRQYDKFQLMTNDIR